MNQFPDKKIHFHRYCGKKINIFEREREKKILSQSIRIARVH